MGAMIDLRKAHAAHKRGDLTVVLSWLNDDRALFLIPNVREKAPWFVILEKVAFEWSDQDPDNVRYLPARAAKACEVLGIEPNRPNILRIVSLVNDYMQDLLRMPTSQPPEKLMGSYGAMTLRGDGKVIAQEEITLEDEGISYG